MNDHPLLNSNRYHYTENTAIKSSSKRVVPMICHNTVGSQQPKQQQPQVRRGGCLAMQQMQFVNSTSSDKSNNNNNNSRISNNNNNNRYNNDGTNSNNDNNCSSRLLLPPRIPQTIQFQQRQSTKHKPPRNYQHPQRSLNEAVVEEEIITQKQQKQNHLQKYQHQQYTHRQQQQQFGELRLSQHHRLQHQQIKMTPMQQHQRRQQQPSINMVPSHRSTRTSHRRTVQDDDDDDASLQQPSRPRRYICYCCYEDISNQKQNHLIVTCSSNTNDKKQQHSFCLNCVRAYIEEFVFAGASYPLRDFQISSKEDDNNSTTGNTTTSSISSSSMGRKLNHHPPQQQQQPVIKKLLPCLSWECTNGCLEDKQLQFALSERLFVQYQQKLQQKIYTDDPNHKKLTAEKTTIETTIPTTTSAKKKPTSIEDEINNSYHKLEEALTLAKIRQCPNCYEGKFIKHEDYCNKLSCPLCKTTLCYICKKDNVNYEHFCCHQQSGCCEDCLTNGIKCPLWTNNEDDYKRDEVYLRELSINIANEIWEQSLLKQQNTINSTNRTEITATDESSSYCYSVSDTTINPSSFYNINNDQNNTDNNHYEIRLDIERILKGPA